MNFTSPYNKAEKVVRPKPDRPDRWLRPWYVQASIQLGEMKFIHDFVVTEQLVAPVILGVDFFTIRDRGICSRFYYLTSKCPP